MTTRPTKKLGEVMDVLRNGKSCKQTKDNIGDKITRIETISDGTINESKIGFYPLTAEDKEKFSIMKGDILFSHINSVEHIGKVALAKKDYNDLFHGMNLLLIRGNKEILDSEFFYLVLTKYFTSGYWRNICKKAINQASLNQPNITEIEIPLPPLDIQKAIVTKLDEVFTEIDEAISLTEGNISKTDEFKKSILDKVFEEGEWKNVKLDNICNFYNEGIIPSKEKNYNYIGLENIESNTGKLIDFKPVLGREIKSNKVVFKKRMILYGKLRPYLNKVFMAEFDGIATTEILPLECSTKIMPEYLAHYLRTEKFVSLANTNISGARMPRVTTKFLKEEIEIPLPPLEKQAEIVSYLDQVFAETSALKSDYETKLTHLKELKASILQSAFEGKLIAE